MAKRANVSWVDHKGHRLFGHFVQWSNDYALVRFGPGMKRIHKRNITFEVQ